MMMHNVVHWLLVGLLILEDVSPTPVNVALNRPITANFTCGTLEPEAFYSHSQVFVSPHLRVQEICTDSSAHFATAMVDGDSATWWQSMSRSRLLSMGYGGSANIAEAVIILDLEQDFSIEGMVIEFAESRRPNRISIDKSLDGNTYTPWVYMVSSESECDENFGVDVREVPSSASSAICYFYSLQFMLNSNETVRFNFSSFPSTLREWKISRYLRIQFYEMDLTLGVPGGDKFQHFTIRNLEVLAECVCNGHHDECLRNPLTGRYGCICGGNTEGQSCDKCKPMFNQMSFQYGVPCQECQCFNHATSCYYDSSVHQLGMSLNKSGHYNGGGVCLHCQHNTTGINCDRCRPYYFRPVNTSQDGVFACQPCSCRIEGVRRIPGSSLLGDCVKNNAENRTSTMEPGSCYCKKNVHGSNCDQCTSGFFNLSADNVDGCQDCLCNADGTVNSTYICNSNGQCPCKRNVIGRTCDMCLDGFYGLNLNNTQGCIPCDCDVGGSYSNLCDKTSGQCPCRQHVTGRSCDRPMLGYYTPEIHFIRGEFEDIYSLKWANESSQGSFYGFGYALLGDNEFLQTAISIPRQSEYYFVIKYHSAYNATLNVTLLGIGSLDVRLKTCVGKWCYRTLDTSVALTPQVYSIYVGTTSSILLDSIIAIPKMFVNQTLSILGSGASNFYKNCDITMKEFGSNQSQIEICHAGVFSLVTYFLNGSSSCDCEGRPNASCNVLGGQCPCPPSIGGRTCDICLPQYYRYNATSQDCTECQCSGENKVCNMSTGQCRCPPNTLDRTCSRCAVNHWNWHYNQGCQACNCNDTGSVDLQCNLTSGLCPCKSGTQGSACDECMDNFTGFSADGCHRCNCDERGSLSTACDKDTDQCPCKNSTTGLHCDVCQDGFFSLSESHPTGCLECICMGITNNCTSTSYKYNKMEIVLDKTCFFQVLNSGFDVFRNIVNQTIVVDGLDMLQLEINSTDILYWREGYYMIGDWLDSYGSELSFNLMYSNFSDGSPTVAVVRIYNKDNHFIQYKLGQIQPDVMTVNMIKLVEAGWLKGETNEKVTRSEFLLALSEIRLLFLPATLHTGVHNTSIGNLSYYKAVEQGSGMHAVDVEQCSCGYEYQGLSCQKCSYGNTRSNTSLVNECEPCTCNNHTGYCDPELGECKNCQHNTTGRHCELCSDGYYGNATDGTGCLECPCYSPSVSQSHCQQSENDTVTCLHCSEGYTGEQCDRCSSFYWGNPQDNNGMCLSCHCHGNSASCNQTTGECLNCAFNSTGWNCETCLEGLHGNTSTQYCEACQCNENGSVDDVCDQRTGQCSCLPGVDGQNCDVCLSNYYGYSLTNVTGCIECSCSATGSSSLQCHNVTGVCQCNANSSGIKCDRCDIGRWGLPYQPCQVCGCDSVGQVEPPVQCDIVTGRCSCKPGVTGRTCNQCERLHFNFNNAGCQECGSCELTLGNETARLQTEYHSHNNTSRTILLVQASDNTLQELTDRLQTLQSEWQTSFSSYDITEQLASLHQNSSEANKSTELQLDELKAYQSAGRHLLNTSKADNERLSNMLHATHSARNRSLAATDELRGILGGLISLNQSAYQIVRNISHLSFKQPFSSELNTTSDELKKIEDLNVRVQQLQSIYKDVLQSEENLTTTLLQASTVLNKTEVGVNSVVKRRDYLQTIITNLLNSFNEIQYYKTEVEVILKEIKDITNTSQFLLTSSEENFRNIETSLSEARNAMAYIASEIARLRTFNETTRYAVLQNSSLVHLAEFYSENLTRVARHIERQFQLVKSQGTRAVDAIRKYETVTATLNTTLSLALAANQTIALSLSSALSMSQSALEAKANQSFSDSRLLLNTVQAFNESRAGFNKEISSLNDSLVVSLQMCAEFDVQIPQLKEHFQKLSVQDTTHISLSNSTLKKAADILQEVDQEGNHSDSIAHQMSLVAVTQTRRNNIFILQTQVLDSVTNSSNKMNSLQLNVDRVSNERSETLQKRQNIQSKLASIQAKIYAARAMAASLEQPVRFYGNSSEKIADPSKISKQLYNEISLEFKTSNVSTGTLVYIGGNSSTESYMWLRLVNGSLKFQFRLGSEYQVITSPVYVCSDCWFKVLVNRYENDGYLTVTDLSSGNVTNSYSTGASSTRHFFPQDSIYIATNPTTSQQHYTGCIQHVQINGQPINLWHEVLKRNGTNCCQKPAQIPGETLIPGVRFNGLGYLELERGNIDVSHDSYLAIQFRTFSPNAVLFKLTQVEMHYGMYLLAGRIVFEVGDAGQEYTLSTKQSYNTGDWFVVSVQHNSSSIQLGVQSVNNSVSSEVVVKSTSTPLTIISSGRTTILIGGINNSTGRGPTNESFAGCISMLTYNTSAGTVVRPLNSSVLSHKDISLDGCHAKVVAGVCYKDQTSYTSLHLPSELASLKILELSFFGKQPSGILLYLQDNFAPNVLLYMTLYHGVMFLQYNYGTPTLSEPIKTQGIYLSDGVEHTVKVDLTGVRAQLTVDGRTFPGSENLRRTALGITSPGTYIYIGGTRLSIPSAFPVTRSFMGSIRNVKINDRLINFFDKSVIKAFNRVCLSGVQPPLPISAMPQPTAPPTCETKLEAGYMNIGRRFGDVSNSYAAFNFSQQKLDSIFKTSFVVITEFRALAPNGIIYYVADTDVNPEYWLCLYMEDGHLVFTMQSSRKSDVTQGIKSLRRYDDGSWWEVNILRINDFIALLVTETGDYRNNRQTSAVSSTLRLSTLFFVGGVGQEVKGSFPTTIGKIPVLGCIRKLYINTYGQAFPHVFNLSNPDVAANTGQCYKEVKPGISISGNGYLTVVSGLNINLPTNLTVNLTAYNNTGRLLTLYHNSTNFIVVELVDGQVQCHLSSSSNPGNLFRVASLATVPIQEICNQQQQQITVTINTIGLTVMLKNNSAEGFAYPSGFHFPLMDNTTLYMGGVPDTVIHPEISTKVLEACIHLINIDGISYNLRNSESLHHVELGCPL